MDARLCQRCSTPIGNANVTGYCRNCVSTVKNCVVCGSFIAAYNKLNVCTAHRHIGQKLRKASR